MIQIKKIELFYIFFVYYMDINESTILLFKHVVEKLELLNFKCKTLEELLDGVRAFYSAKE